MIPSRVLILGCGFTGRRVARKLSAAGVEVICTNRSASPSEGATAVIFDAADPNSIDSLEALLRPGILILHSIPLIKKGDQVFEHTGDICNVLRRSPPARVVYLSTTGVYGEQQVVDEQTVPAPKTRREWLRVEAEAAVAGGPWSFLVLRPAAIYGPWRGVHAAVRAGTFRVPEDATRITSRIHVDDLAELAVSALFSELSGAFPVADEAPCSSLEVARYSAELLGICMPASPALDRSDEARRPDRRVDGSAIRRHLDTRLQYPSYREGIPACIRIESICP